jgi:serine/threonine-protein kinase
VSEDGDSRARERVGRVLDDKWTLERLLGVGGMAAVYAARHRNGARAAVKVLHPDLSRHKDVRERFLREGYAANKVGHAGAVKVLDDDTIKDGPDAGTAYIVMELLEGESLQDRLERGPPVGEREFLEIVDRVLDVLEAAHSRGVVHRDLKPENLFLVKGGGVKVLDFGLARLLQGQAITTYGLALGTPSFMSPEQAAGRIDEIDGRTDLFALAATGFRLRTGGRRIHEAANAVELVRKMAAFAAPRLRSLAPETSEAYARVIDRALEFRREDRYPDAAAMRADVAKALGELDSVGATQLQVRGAQERTMDISEADLVELSARPKRSRPEPSESAPPEPSEPSSQAETQGAPTRRPPPPGIDESIHIPKRRSILPWVALLLFAGIGVKLWLDEHSRQAIRGAAEELLHGATAGESATASASAPSSASPIASASVAPTASAPSQIAPTPPRPAPTTTTPRRPPPAPPPTRKPGTKTHRVLRKPEGKPRRARTPRF